MDSLKKHYETLELAPGSSMEEVERAFEDLKTVWDPKRFPGSNGRLKKKAEAKLGRIEEAFNAIRSFRPRILIVDDDPSVVEVLAEALAGESYRVFTAPSAELALDLLKRERVDVIISDEKMPGMPGTEFLAIACKKYPETIRISLTAYATLDTAIKAINEGHIYRFFQKPPNLVDINVTIRQALEQKELKRRSARLEHCVKEQTLEIRAKNDQLKMTNAKLKSSFQNTIIAFSGLMELRDKVSKNHSRNVAEVAVKAANMMGLASEDVETIAVASLLHDIGKIGIPDLMLTKNPDEMSPDEREIYEEHPVRGQAAIDRIEDLRRAGIIIRHHHEHYGGTGFPDGLAGEKIPIGARIIAIADYIDRVIGLYDADNAMEMTLGNVKERLGRQFDGKLLPFVERVAREFYKENLPIVGAVELELRPGDLKEGMIISRDVRSGTGLLILSKGIRLDGISIQALKRYYQVDPSKTGVFVWSRR